MNFQKVQNLQVWQALPFKVTLFFQQDDPDCPEFKEPLDLGTFTLQAALKGAAKAKAYEVVMDDPPTPGNYVLLLVWGENEYTLTIVVEPGDSAAEFIEKLEKAIEALLIDYLKVCPKKCGGSALYVLGLWPGLPFELSIVSQPDDDLQIDLLQEDAPLQVFTVSSTVQGDYLAITLTLSAKETSILPTAAGPYQWSLIGLSAGPPEDVLLLARGLVVVAASPTT